MPAPSSAGVIDVPTDFVTSLSDTRTHGHYEVVDAGLHIWTDGSKDVDPTTKRNLDKVAEYVATKTDLADAGTPSLEYADSDVDLTDPGFQLVVDLDGDGDTDGILVGETAYDGDWWLSQDKTSSVDLATAPPAGHGHDHAGTLTAWTEAFPDAVVTAFGFSLGSGVHGDGVLQAVNFAGTRYTFAVVLQNKDECKNGGWATSTLPAYKNQGECVSRFATASNNGNGANPGTGTGTARGTDPGTKVSPTTATAASTGTSRGTGGTTKKI